MEISDYTLINDINILFDYPLIVYGAGNVGGKIVKILQQVGLEIYCFCDRDKRKKAYYGYEVKHIEELGKIIKYEQYSIILASDIYYEEMLLQLEDGNIKAKYVFTGWGVESGLIWNLNDKRIPAEFRKYQIQKVDKIFSYQRDKVAINGLQMVLLQKPEVLIYQIGKVGSMTIYNSLKQQNVNCAQVHVLCDYGDSEEGNLLKVKYQNELRENGVKIISLVRDPIARFISAKLQGSNFACWAINNDGKNMNERCMAELALKNVSQSGWFHVELEQMTGIDVLEYPFNRDKGYSVIREGKVELLLLTMEKLGQNKDVIADFVGIKDFHLISTNMGKNKVTKYIYKSMKEELQFPDRILDYYYRDDVFTRHFYNDDQLKKFRDRWKYG